MKQRLICGIILALLSFTARSQTTIVFHTAVQDSAGRLESWYSPNHGASYDHVLGLIWNFWQDIDTCCGGQKFYMIDHAYNNPVAGNMVGGDQFAMLLSSWALYYAYTGDTGLIKDMVYIADTYLANSLSASNDLWPDLPYPANYTNNYNAIYDGDFLLGEGFTQPNKAASFAAELVTLYKITGNNDYLQAAIKIANTLADKVEAGDADHGPYPFKVNTHNGNTNPLGATFDYTANVTPDLRLFEELSAMGVGQTSKYNTAYNIIVQWVKQYPLQSNEWGSFFEDIWLPSNTEINAVSMAWYILEHPNWGSLNTRLQDARGILDWTLSTLGSNAYDSLGVTAIYEQSVDLKEGGSHTSRFASIELLYSLLSGDTSRHDQAIRQLNWSTYLCDTSGLCRFSPRSGSPWYTDGYGDYVRHFLRAMAYDPTLATDSANHLLGSTSVVTWVNYAPDAINYTTYDSAATETFRLTSKPTQVRAGGQLLTELSALNGEGYTWTAYETGGALKVQHDNATDVAVLWYPVSAERDQPLIENFKVYPNPSTGMLTLQLSDVKDEVSVKVYDITGQVVRNIERTNRSDMLSIDLSDRPAGQYIIQVRTNDRVMTQKIEKLN